MRTGSLVFSIDPGVKSRSLLLRPFSVVVFGVGIAVGLLHRQFHARAALAAA